MIGPHRIDKTGIERPSYERLTELSFEYPAWSLPEIYDLYYFIEAERRDKGSVDLSQYKKAYCSECQMDHGYVHQAPKVEVVFRDFVSLCNRNHYDILCNDCRRAMLRKAVETQSKIINLDQEYQDARFANWIVREDWQQGILDSAKKFVDSLRDQRGYFIAGGAGTGKTRIVCTIINELQRRLGVDYKMIFLKYSTLLIEARKKGDPMKYMSYDLVCIDDLTKEGVGMEFAQYVYPLIESRYANKKQLLITSNMALETWLGHSDNYVRRLGDRFRNFMRRATFGKESMRGGKI